MTATLQVVNWVTVLAWAACAVGLSWYCHNIARQITYVMLADGRQQERKVPLLFRLLLPFVSNLDGVVMRPAFKKARDAADRQFAPVHIRPSAILRTGAPAPVRPGGLTLAARKTAPSYGYGRPPSTPGVKKSPRCPR